MSSNDEDEIGQPRSSKLNKNVIIKSESSSSDKKCGECGEEGVVDMKAHKNNEYNIKFGTSLLSDCMYNQYLRGADKRREDGKPQITVTASRSRRNSNIDKAMNTISPSPRTRTPNEVSTESRIRNVSSGQRGQCVDCGEQNIAIADMIAHKAEMKERENGELLKSDCEYNQYLSSRWSGVGKGLQITVTNKSKSPVPCSSTRSPPRCRGRGGGGNGHSKCPDCGMRGITDMDGHKTTLKYRKMVWSGGKSSWMSDCRYNYHLRQYENITKTRRCSRIPNLSKSAQVDAPMGGDQVVRNITQIIHRKPFWWRPPSP